MKIHALKQLLLMLVLKLDGIHQVAASIVDADARVGLVRGAMIENQQQDDSRQLQGNSGTMGNGGIPGGGNGNGNGNKKTPSPVQAPTPNAPCGCVSCTDSILNTLANGFSCLDRITYKQVVDGLTELDACRFVSDEVSVLFYKVLLSFFYCFFLTLGRLFVCFQTSYYVPTVSSRMRTRLPSRQLRRTMLGGRKSGRSKSSAIASLGAHGFSLLLS